MVWFKTDDGWHSHPKVIGLTMAARGLWVSAGSWSGFHLTDGVIPSAVVAYLGGTKRLATALVDAGLWEVCKEGWRFHEWEKHQPSKADVFRQRELKSNRQARWREGIKKSVDASTYRLRDGAPSRPDPTRPLCPSDTEQPPSAGPEKKRRSKATTAEACSAHSEGHRLRLAFETEYRSHYGSEHLWRARYSVHAKELVAVGLDEAIRRVKIGFESAPSWVRNGGTLDFGAFYNVFNRLARPAEAVLSPNRTDVNRAEFDKMLTSYVESNGKPLLETDR